MDKKAILLQLLDPTKRPHVSPTFPWQTQEGMDNIMKTMEGASEVHVRIPGGFWQTQEGRDNMMKTMEGAADEIEANSCVRIVGIWHCGKCAATRGEIHLKIIYIHDLKRARACTS